MKAGTLDKVIIIQSRTETKDASGQGVPTWSNFVTVYADILEVRDEEAVRANQKMGIVELKMRIRYYPSVTTTMRVSYNSNYYNIKGVQELGRKDGMMLFVELQKNML